MKLLIDIGNSRLKWATLNNHRIIAAQPVLHDQFIEEDLLRLWREMKPPDHIAISNVSSAEKTDYFKKLTSKLWPSIEVIVARSQAEAFGVTNAYSDPEKLGVDRWLLLLALRNNYELPAIVVDCGTAMTLDVLDDEGVHQGGLIAPGLILMKKSLNQKTHHLQFSDQIFQIGLSTSTDAAIYSGTLYSAIGLIELIKSKLNNITGMNYSLVLSGGDAQIIAKHLSIPSFIEPNMVLQGLSILLEDQK